jgi:hypothetical protein
MALPLAPFVILLLVALGAMTEGLWRGHWLTVAVNVVIMVIAIWGLRLPRRPAAEAVPPLITGRPTRSSTGVCLAPRLKDPGSRTAAQPLPYEAAAATANAPAPQDVPVVDSLAITGRIHTTPTGSVGNVGLVLPGDTEAPTPAVIAALLTAGHQILADHPRTDRPLPEVEITSVDRTGKPPPTTPAAGFTVHITNNRSMRHSDITLEAGQRLGAEERPLLIAATLLAGAEHLLDHPERPLHHRNSPGCPKTGPDETAR